MFCFLFFPKQCFELCELKTPKKAESSHVALKYLGFNVKYCWQKCTVWHMHNQALWQRLSYQCPASVTHKGNYPHFFFNINIGYYSNTELFIFPQVYYVGAKEHVQTLHAFITPQKCLSTAFSKAPLMDLLSPNNCSLHWTTPGTKSKQPSQQYHTSNTQACIPSSAKIKCFS